MCFKAAISIHTVRAKRRGIGVSIHEGLLCTKWKIRSRDNLDEVHKVVRRIAGRLVGAIERVEVVICPGKLGAKIFVDISRYLWTKSQLVNLVRKSMAFVYGSIEVIVEVMYVHRAIAEASTRRDMEVANDLIYAQVPLNPASFVSLSIESFPIMFSFTLFHPLASSKCPAHTCVRFADIVTSVAATDFLSVGRGVGTEAFSTVFGVKMRGGLID